MRGDDDQSSPPVDWERYATGVESRATPRQLGPLGNPSRWGAQVDQDVTALGLFVSPQLNLIDTVDPYSRQWVLAGNVLAPPDVWALDGATFKLFLEVTSGVGQNTIIQRFDLRALIALAAPWYGDVFSSSQAVESKPWFIDGGIVGRAWNSRVFVVMVDAGFVGSRRITTSANAAPLAAGAYI